MDVSFDIFLGMNCITDADLSVGLSEKDVLFEHIMRKLRGELYLLSVEFLYRLRYTC